MKNSEVSDADKIAQVLEEVDPQQLFKTNVVDSYLIEARILLWRVVDQPLTAQYVRDVWLVMFETGENMISSQRGRHNIKTRTWIGDMPMLDEFQQVADRVNTLFPQGGPRKPLEL